MPLGLYETFSTILDHRGIVVRLLAKTILFPLAFTDFRRPPLEPSQPHSQWVSCERWGGSRDHEVERLPPSAVKLNE